MRRIKLFLLTYSCIAALIDGRLAYEIYTDPVATVMDQTRFSEGTILDRRNQMLLEVVLMWTVPTFMATGITYGIVLLIQGRRKARP